MDAQSTTEEVPFRADIPTALKEEIDALPEFNKEIAIRAFRRELGLQLTELEQIEDELSRKRERLAELSAEEEEIKREKNKVKSEIEELEAAQEEAKQSQSLEDELEEFLQFIEDRGTHVDSEFPRVQELADKHRVSTTEVLESLNEMSDLPASRFGVGDEIDSNDGPSVGELQ